MKWWNDTLQQPSTYRDVQYLSKEALNTTTINVIHMAGRGTHSHSDSWKQRVLQPIIRFTSSFTIKAHLSTSTTWRHVGVEVIAPLVLNLGTTRSTSPPYPLNRQLGGPQSQAGPYFGVIYLPFTLSRELHEDARVCRTEQSHHLYLHHMRARSSDVQMKRDPYYNTNVLKFSGFHGRATQFVFFWVLTSCADSHPQDYTVSNPWRPYDFRRWPVC
jgi:hypothetical protein